MQVDVTNRDDIYLIQMFVNLIYCDSWDFIKVNSQLNVNTYLIVTNNLLSIMKGGHKLVVQQEWFIECNYTAKHESTNDCKIDELTKITLLKIVRYGFPSLLCKWSSCK